MAALVTTSAVTEHPAPAKGGFPPFKVETYPSQLFWLAVTFAFLFVVMWRIAGPRIVSALNDRKMRISSDIEEAEKHRREAEEASAAYQSALAAARARAQAVAEENRKRISAEVERAKAAAEAEAQKSFAAAEARIASLHSSARSNIATAAQDVAQEIADRLIGAPATPGDRPVASTRESGTRR